MVFRLLDLPRELRDRIHFFSLTNYQDPLHKYIAITPHGFWTLQYIDAHGAEANKSLAPHIAHSLNLLKTNRQVYREASPHLYDTNNFFLFIQTFYTLSYCPQHTLRARLNLLSRISSITISNIETGLVHSVFDALDFLERYQSPFKRLHLDLARPTKEADIRGIVDRAMGMALEVKVSVAKVGHFPYFRGERYIRSVGVVGRFLGGITKEVDWECRRVVDMDPVQMLSREDKSRDAQWVLKPQ